MLKKAAFFLLYMSVFMIITDHAYSLKGTPAWLNKKGNKTLVTETLEEDRFKFAVCDCTQENNSYVIDTVLHSYNTDSHGNTNYSAWKYNKKTKDFHEEILEKQLSDDKICESIQEHYNIYIWSEPDSPIDLNTDNLKIISNTGEQEIIPEHLGSFRLGEKSGTGEVLRNEQVCHITCFDEQGYAYIQYKSGHEECKGCDNIPDPEGEAVYAKNEINSQNLNTGNTQADRKENQVISDKAFPVSRELWVENKDHYYFFDDYGYVKLNRKFSCNNSDIKDNYKFFFITNITANGEIEYSPVYYEGSECKFFQSYASKFEQVFLWKQENGKTNPAGKLLKLKTGQSAYSLNPLTLAWKIDSKEANNFFVETAKAYDDFLKSKQSFDDLVSIACLKSTSENKKGGGCEEFFKNLINNAEQIKDNGCIEVKDKKDGNFFPVSAELCFEKSGDIWRLKKGRTDYPEIMQPGSEKKLWELKFHKNSWDEIIHYLEAPIYKDRNKLYVITKESDSIFNSNAVLMSTKFSLTDKMKKPVGTWMIVDDYLENEKTKIFRQFKSSKYFHDLETKIRGMEVSRIDIIQGAEVKKSLIQIYKNSIHPNVSEIESLATLSGHDSNNRVSSWELHLFLLIDTSSTKESAVKNISDKLKELNVERIMVWEFYEHEPTEGETYYNRLFSKVSKKIKAKYKHQIINNKELFKNIKTPLY
jgi:hypothetical protein